MLGHARPGLHRVRLAGDAHDAVDEHQRLVGQAHARRVGVDVRKGLAQHRADLPDRELQTCRAVHEHLASRRSGDFAGRRWPRAGAALSRAPSGSARTGCATWNALKFSRELQERLVRLARSSSAADAAGPRRGYAGAATRARRRFGAQAGARSVRCEFRGELMGAAGRRRNPGRCGDGCSRGAGAAAAFLRRGRPVQDLRARPPSGSRTQACAGAGGGLDGRRRTCAAAVESLQVDRDALGDQERREGAGRRDLVLAAAVDRRGRVRQRARGSCRSCACRKPAGPVLKRCGPHPRAPVLTKAAKSTLRIACVVIDCAADSRVGS